MQSLRHLSHTPTCLTEEFEALRAFNVDIKSRKQEFLAFVREFPELRIFLGMVEKRLGPTASATLWFRIWCAMRDDARNGSTATVDALSELRSFDPRDIDYPPVDCDKPLSFYLDKLSELVETTAS